MPNRVRFDGRAERFYEVWYFIFNDLASGDGFWIRYTLLNPLDSRPEAGAALWFAYTCKANPARSIAIQRAVGGDFTAPPGEFTIRIGGATLEEGALRGGLEADGHSASWELRYQAAPEPHYYFGERLRRLTARRTSVTLPNPRILLSGQVSVDGRTIDVSAAPGHQAHHWGVERAPRWLWGHCCAFENEQAVLELLAPEGPGGITVTFLNLHTAEWSLRCDGIPSLLRNRSAAGLGFWRFTGYGGERRIVADISVNPEHVQRFVYTSPGYRSSECWNTQVGDCLVRVTRGSSTLEKVLWARGTAAAEIHDERPERIPYAAWRGRT